MKTCSTCKWWDRQGKPSITSRRQCKRYPRVEQKWSDDWCGEWKPEQDGLTPYRTLKGQADEL